MSESLHRESVALTAPDTGRIVVDGNASDPQLSFRSTPAVPEDEVLPRTLFGKSKQSLTGSQAISLALGLATLMDGSGGTLDTVRGVVGLDSLRLDQDEEGNASVAVGKEVADGVWVGTKTPLGEGGVDHGEHRLPRNQTLGPGTSHEPDQSGVDPWCGPEHLGTDVTSTRDVAVPAGLGGRHAVRA